MHTQPAIALQSLYKNYGTVHALRGAVKLVGSCRCG